MELSLTEVSDDQEAGVAVQRVWAAEAAGVRYLCPSP